MKNMTYLFCCAAVLSCCVMNTASAQPPEGGRGEGQRREGGGRPGGGRPGEGGPGGFMQALPVMRALDADKDGEISAKEIEGAVAALKALDKNKDGKIDASEMRPDFSQFRGGRGQGQPGRGQGQPGRGGNTEEFLKRIMENDKNKDGKLGGDEVSERLQGFIKQADADKDGFVTKEELKKFIEERSSRGGQQGSRGGQNQQKKPERPNRPAIN